MHKHLLLGCAIALAPLVAAADKTFTGASQGAWDCGKDPSVHILRGAGSFKFKGSCATIVVEGGSNKLVIESVDSLQIVGASNKIEVGTLGAVKVVGSVNQLTWKRAKSGDAPEVSAIGTGNEIRKRE
jgi:hypothetical protein